MNHPAPLHLAFDELERGLANLSPPAGRGRVELIVSRGDDGSRETPVRVIVTPETGVPGDRWSRGNSPRLDAQITVMRADFARLIGNGQPLSVPGDNLIVDFDLSAARLPAGTRLHLAGPQHIDPALVTQVVLSSDRNLSPGLKEALAAFVGAEQARNEHSIRQSYTDRDEAFEAFKTKLFGKS